MEVNERNGMPVLELEGVRKRYAAGRVRPFEIHDVSLRIHPGEIVRVRGASGTGKSTVLRIAGLLSAPDAGTVRVCGDTPRTWRQRDWLRAQHIGVVFQDGGLFGHLTVLENLRVANRKNAGRRKCLSLLGRFGIGALADVRAAKLSGGELQRAGICRALINDPQLLLLDEPTSSLDDEATRCVAQTIAMLQRERVGILLASHDRRLDGLDSVDYALGMGNPQGENHA